MKQTIQIEKVSNGFLIQSGKTKLVANNSGEVTQKIAEALALAIRPDKKQVGDLFYVTFEFESDEKD